jgi:hypothetical protein
MSKRQPYGAILKCATCSTIYEIRRKVVRTSLRTPCCDTVPERPRLSKSEIRRNQHRTFKDWDEVAALAAEEDENASELRGYGVAPIEAQRAKAARPGDGAEVPVLGDGDASPFDGVTVAGMWVTPSTARAMLDSTEVDNRRARPKHVERFARVIREGRWRVNGETVVIDDKGNLIDGQHRLLAIIRAGAPAPMLIVRGVPTEAFTSLDQGSVRTAADVLGLTGETNCSTLSTMLKILLAYDEDRHAPLSTISRANFDTEHIITAAHTYEGLAESVKFGKRVNKHVGLAGPMAFCHSVFSREWPEAADDFFEILETGVASTKGNPAVVLRDKLIAEKLYCARNRRPRDRISAIYMTFRAWHAYIRGEEIRTIRMPNVGTVVTLPDPSIREGHRIEAV